MGIARGPNVINDGLVFGCDTGYGIADNETSTRFYPGEPTTNEFYNTGSAGNILNHASGYGGYGTVQSGALDAFGTTNCNVYRNTGKIRLGPTGGQDIGTLTNGNTYTWSIYLKHVAGQTESTSMEFDIVDRADSRSYSGTLGSNMTYEWKRFSVTALHNNSANYHFLDLGVNQGTNVFDWCMPQIDVGSHATPHTKTSRSDTASLIDLKRTGSIDVGDVSFDSNAQPVFDGTDDYIIVPDNDDYSFTDAVATWEAWVKPTGNAGVLEHNIMCKANYSLNTREYQFQVRYSSGVYYFFLGQQNNNTTWKSIGSSSTSAISINQWHHIIVTSDGGGNAQMYINGESRASATGWHTSQTNLGAPLCIGATINGTDPIQEFVGSIAVCRLYNKHFSQQEALQNYKANKNRFNT